MEKILTHWKKLENPDYLGSYSLAPGEELVAQIKAIGQEKVYNPSGKSTEDCTVVRFTDSSIKPMILNVTNCKTIEKLYETPYIEDWTGKYITIYSTKVKAFGEVVDALRIKNKKPILKTFICEDCGSTIVGVGSKTAEDIAKMGVRDYKKMLCIGCAQKEMDKLKAEKAEKEEEK